MSATEQRWPQNVLSLIFNYSILAAGHVRLLLPIFDMKATTGLQ